MTDLHERLESLGGELERAMQLVNDVPNPSNSYDLHNRRLNSVAHLTAAVKVFGTVVAVLEHPEPLAEPQEPISGDNTVPGSLSDTHDGTHPHNTKGDA